MWALLGALLAAALPRAAAQIGDAAFEPVGGVPVCEKPPEPVGTTVRVATPACLQAAIDTGAQHVIITSHMNLTNLPSLQDSVGTDAVLGSRPNTRSLRVRPTAPPPRLRSARPTPVSTSARRREQAAR